MTFHWRSLGVESPREGGGEKPGQGKWFGDSNEFLCSLRNVFNWKTFSFWFRFWFLSAPQKRTAAACWPGHKPLLASSPFCPPCWWQTLPPQDHSEYGHATYCAHAFVHKFHQVSIFLICVQSFFLAVCLSCRLPLCVDWLPPLAIAQDEVGDGEKDKHIDGTEPGWGWWAGAKSCYLAGGSCAVRMQMRTEIENEFIQRNSKNFLLNFCGQRRKCVQTRN